MQKYLLLLAAVILPCVTALHAQEKKQITVEDVWAKGTFRPQMLPGFNWIDDDSYSDLVEDKIVKSDVLQGKVTDTLFYNKEGIAVDDYFFTEDKSKIILLGETDHIYRHSFKALYYIYDRQQKTLRKISEDKIAYVTFSPDGKMLAYVKDNNLYYASLEDLVAHPVTNDGKINFIINGSTDWVYEEEFSFTKAFVWSPDSKKIAFLRFDESEVKEYSMQLWNGLYPGEYRFKYPKAGEKNSELSVHCFSIENQALKKIYAYPGDGYIPRLLWTRDPDLVSVQTLNRLQNHFQILHIHAGTSDTSVAYEEKNNTYVEITDDLTYLKDGKHFLITSEKDGYKHIYKYTLSGKLVAQVTKGEWEVDQMKGIDERSGLVYYTSTEASPLGRQLYASDLAGKVHKRLSEAKGTHEVEFSPGYKYYMDVFSTLNTPPSFSLHLSASGKQVKVFEENQQLKQAMSGYALRHAEFFSFKTPDDVSLNGYMLKPGNMEVGKKYPVMLFVYGGPGFQTVKDSWQGPNYFWFQMLVQQGYIVVSVDNRGTGGRGAAFKKITQNNLGKYETEDVIHTARYLATLPFVDKDRIGIFGWSFGGYLSSLAMTLGADYFKTGIAVAPVISWRFYDTIYTERYLGLPQENSEGYDKNSPLSHAARLKGKYLLVHGTADDNVHLQNSMMMEDALIKANKQFRVFYYPNRNHGIYGGNTRLHLYKMMTDFILTNL